MPGGANHRRREQSADQACDLFASKVVDFAVVHPDPGAGTAQDFCNFGGAEKHLAGIELGSAGADGCEGVAVEGFFAGHGVTPFLIGHLLCSRRAGRERGAF